MASFKTRSPRGRKQLAHNFTRVKNTEYEKEGSVDEYLDKQFTVNYDDGTFGFLFYADKGDTWTPLDEGDTMETVQDRYMRFVMESSPQHSLNPAPTPSVWATPDAPQDTIMTVIDELEDL